MGVAAGGADAAGGREGGVESGEGFVERGGGVLCGGEIDGEALVGEVAALGTGAELGKDG